MKILTKKTFLENDEKFKKLKKIKFIEIKKKILLFLIIFSLILGFKNTNYQIQI